MGGITQVHKCTLIHKQATNRWLAIRGKTLTFRGWRVGEKPVAQGFYVSMGKARAVKGFPLVVRLVRQDVVHTGERQRAWKREASFLLCSFSSPSHPPSCAHSIREPSGMQRLDYPEKISSGYFWIFAMETVHSVIDLHYAIKTHFRKFSLKFVFTHSFLSLPLVESHACGRNKSVKLYNIMRIS